MPLVPGLSPNIRLVDPDNDVIVTKDDMNIDLPNDGDASKEYDANGNLMTIKLPDGSITFNLDGSPLEQAENANPKGWFDNLVDQIDQMELARIADDLLRGIEADEESRREWVSDRAEGIKLMGLKIEIPGLVGAGEGAPVEGMSRVRHPLLLEAVLRFQANARSELLPTDGPVKIREDNNNATDESDALANDLENDMNHYLTSTATEYYPDTDRMLLMLGFGGTAFKKVYFCPLRNRPVSESIDAEDLIVNDAATDLGNARRITHKIMMRPSVVKRMQLIGAYRDVALPDARQPILDAAQLEKKNQQGISDGGMYAEDRDRQIYECYCELDIKGLEHKSKGKETGLEIPYCVTIDVSSKEILSIVRNYDEDTKELPEARVNFVKYPFVPGLGFYDIGLLHILGNTTNAVTAAWREMLDSGMYANFPGFLFADVGGRQDTNILRVPPGGGASVKTGGMPINQAIMPLPYKDVTPGLMGLVDNMAQTGMRIGGTAEQAVGEGRGDAPVGTTIALIDQATKVLNAVHKRLHFAQAQEFQLLIERFREHPESFWQRNKKAARKWDEATFLRALDQVDLVPQADPNTASQTQRLMKVQALKMIASANPTMYDMNAVDMVALQSIGWANPEKFLKSPQEMSMPPEAEAKIAELKIQQQDADTRKMAVEGKVQLDQAKVQLDMQKAQQEQSSGLVPDKSLHDKKVDGINLIIQEKLADAKINDARIKAAQLGAMAKKDDFDNRVKEMEVIGKERAQMLDLAGNIAVHPESEQVVKNLLGNVIPSITGEKNVE